MQIQNEQVDVEEKQPLLSGQLARLAGVKPDTVRFYEKQGLLPKAVRAANAYRVYEGKRLDLGVVSRAQDRS